MADHSPPLVTFALFAFNQENYVHEAIEGAFAQSFDRLEIILSDDCSSDRTFAIMQDMAARYAGPHLVRARRNATNIGTIDHVLTVAREMKGQLLVVAAGDDVSYPNRTGALAQAWHASKAAVLYSNHDEFTGRDGLTAVNLAPKPNALIQGLFEGCEAPRRYAGHVRHIPGFSAAYDRDLLSSLPFNGKKALNEDALTTFLANLRGDHIEHVPVSLMKYRVENEAVSARRNDRSAHGILQTETKLIRFAESRVNFLQYFYPLAERINPKDSRLLLPRLKRQEGMSGLMIEMNNQNFLRRLSTARKIQDLRQFKYWLSRLFGTHLFSQIKLGASRVSAALRR